jgi:hypothetical protein
MFKVFGLQTLFFSPNGSINSFYVPAAISGTGIVHQLLGNRMHFSTML